MFLLYSLNYYFPLIIPFFLFNTTYLIVSPNYTNMSRIKKLSLGTLSFLLLNINYKSIIKFP